MGPMHFERVGRGTHPNVGRHTSFPPPHFYISIEERITGQVGDSAST